MQHAAPDAGNHLLDALDAADREAAARVLVPAQLAAGQTVCEAGKPPETVVFPIDTVLSIIFTSEDGATCDVGTIGREAASAVAAPPGRPALRTVVCEIPGRALCVEAAEHERLLRTFAGYDGRLASAVAAHMYFAQQQTACNALHSVQQRFARWLLQAMERTGRAQFEFTHEFFAMLLAVRRATVTVAAQEFQRLGALVYRRGEATILDRSVLVSAACACFEETRHVFASLLGTQTQGAPR